MLNRLLNPVKLLAVLLVTSLVTGCSVKMTRDESASFAKGAPSAVVTAAKAEGIDGKVGWGRFTMFYIPVVPVYIEGDGNELVMEQVHKALRQGGHQVAILDKNPEGPILNVKVDQFWFNNYTWLFPLVPTWGSIELTVRVVGPDGDILWKKSFEGSGFTLNFFNGYTSAAEKSVEKLVSDMSEAFSAPDFKDAFVKKPGPLVKVSEEKNLSRDSN